MVEVIVALGVLAVMVAGILGSFKYGFFVMQSVRENQRATQIMLAKFETIRLYRWDQVNSNGFIPTTFTDVYDPQGPAGQQGATYTGTVTVTNCGSPISTTSYATNMRQCTISLRWTTGSMWSNNSLTNKATGSTKGGNERTIAAARSCGT